MFNGFEFIKNAQLNNYSTMKVGGEADFLIFPKNILELKEILKIIAKNGQKYMILGNGSNVLFSDKGYRGVVISLKYFNQISKNGNFVNVGSGVNLFALNLKLKEFGLSGLEWSFGIPATLGGLLVMNGGSFGHEICEFVEEVVAFEDGKIKRLKREEIEFSYRHSNLQNKVILSAKLRLFPQKSEIIEKNMQDCFQKKKDSQPLEYPSLGSVFKIVEGDPIVYPAKIIDNLGLKGVKIGGAEVSKKHAGFIVNSTNATSDDILRLVEVLERVLADAGVEVEREIIVLEE